MIINKDFPNYFDGITESPIETDFAYALCKILKPGINFDSQTVFSTKLGEFRGDFIIQDNYQKVLIELDGKEFHERSNDIWRDSFILGEKKVDLIVRFNGKDIVYNLNECCYILMEKLPDFFSERSKTNFVNLIEPKNLVEIQTKTKENESKSMDLNYFSLIYFDDKDKQCESILEMHYKSGSGGYWEKFYNYAINNSIFKVDLLNKNYFQLTSFHETMTKSDSI